MAKFPNTVSSTFHLADISRRSAAYAFFSFLGILIPHLKGILMLLKKLSDLTISDILALKENRVRENRSLDFKRMGLEIPMGKRRNF
jgi:hypothetical protein